MQACLRCWSAGCTLAALGLTQAPVLDHPALLARLTDVAWAWHPPAAGERCGQWTSDDRSSHPGPGAAGAWSGNGDRGQHLRVAVKDGVHELVMVDGKGPGCVARSWFDGDSERIDSSGPRALGVVALPAGEAELRLALTGKHDRAKPCHMVGLDYVRLEKLQ